MTRPQPALVQHWIAGARVAGTGSRTGDVFDPRAGIVAKHVAFASADDVDTAVAAGKAAFGPWRATSLAERARILFAFRELVAGRADELAAIVSSEHGKVLDDARGEVARALEVIEFACNVGHLLKGEFSESVSNGIDVHSVRQPLGVVAVITPFNFPAMVPCWFFPIAIACGNAVVLKPSEKDPSAAIWLAEVWQEAALPDGVFNVVHGDDVAVGRLLEHPDVKAVSFVGSTPVARTVYEAATRAGKRVQALGGAKNHMVVLPDADLDAAADAAVNAGFGSAGERCMAVSALVAVGDIADDLVDRIARRIKALDVGAGDCDMGPLVTRAHRDRVASYLEAGVAAGAVLVVDGRQHPIEGRADGFWLGPSLFDHVTPDMAVYADEIFGPVLSVLRVGDLAQAIALVNANPYGNGAAVFTADGAAARRFQNEVEAGMVGINVPIPVPVATYSFGGWKQSLFGDTHAHGMEGVRFFTRNKVVTTRWLGAGQRGIDLGFPEND